ncbi:MAG: hypothetical protein HY323_07170 [Betaproteobacteria bacterium]|nr:hypothetical protein [Betaproteobacteria bacterium]
MSGKHDVTIHLNSMGFGSVIIDGIDFSDSVFAFMVSGCVGEASRVKLERYEVPLRVEILNGCRRVARFDDRFEVEAGTLVLRGAEVTIVPPLARLLARRAEELAEARRLNGERA